MHKVNNRRYMAAVFAFFCCAIAQAKDTTNKGVTKVAGADFRETHYQLLLAGGALEVCSSFSPNHCADDVPLGKRQNRYQITQASLREIELKSKSKSLLTLTNTLSSSSSEQVYGKAQLNNLFAELGLISAIGELSDHDYYLLYDQLEIQSVSQKNTARLKEVAQISSTKSEATKAIINTFIQQVTRNAQSEQKSPTILVVTASSRDSYAVVDYYQSLFASTGVITQWLPIDRAFQEAMEQRACAELESIQAKHQIFNRKQVYPDLFALQLRACQNPDTLLALINSAHGVFFNGGDQSFSRQALFDSQGKPNKMLNAIFARVSAGKMIVGGTSAGTAVQAGSAFNNHPIPMITNGISKNAITRGVFAQEAPSQRCVKDCFNTPLSADDVTYHPDGGSGLLPFASSDTHFSERNREGRFIALNALTKTQFGVGVDENTALLVSMDDMSTPSMVELSTVGAHGVFIYDGKATKVRKTDDGFVFGGYVHFLPQGSHVQITLARSHLEFSFVPTADNAIKSDSVQQGLWRHYAQKICKTTPKVPQTWILEDIKYELKPLPKTKFWLGEQGLCGYAYLGYEISP